MGKSVDKAGQEGTHATHDLPDYGLRGDNRGGRVLQRRPRPIRHPCPHWREQFGRGRLRVFPILLKQSQESGESLGQMKVPQVTHRFPGSRWPSSPSCSESGSTCLSAHSPVSGSAQVYDPRVPLLPLNPLGHGIHNPCAFRCQEHFFRITSGIPHSRGPARDNRAPFQIPCPPQNREDREPQDPQGQATQLPAEIGSSLHSLP